MRYDASMNDTVLLIIAALLMLGGIAGVIIPALPGIPFMWLIALGYFLIDKLDKVTGWELGLLGGIAILSLIVDYLAGTLGARLSGASPRSLGIGLIGLVIGLVLFPPFGSILGLFAGIFLSELRGHKDQQRAFKAASGGVIGSMAGILTNLLLSIGFLILFIVFAVSS